MTRNTSLSVVGAGCKYVVEKVGGIHVHVSGGGMAMRQVFMGLGLAAWSEDAEEGIHQSVLWGCMRDKTKCLHHKSGKVHVWSHAAWHCRNMKGACDLGNGPLFLQFSKFRGCLLHPVHEHSE